MSSITLVVRLFVRTFRTMYEDAPEKMKQNGSVLVAYKFVVYLNHQSYEFLPRILTLKVAISVLFFDGN